MALRVQANLGDIAGFVPDYCNAVNSTMQPVVIFLLVRVLPSIKKQKTKTKHKKTHLWSAIK